MNNQPSITPEQLKKLFPGASKSCLAANSQERKIAVPTCYMPTPNDFLIASRDLREGVLNVHFRRLAFIVNTEPIGAPRMTRRDKWLGAAGSGTKRRDCVAKYFAFRDAVRGAVSEQSSGEIPATPIRADYAFFIPMPDSWSEKKKNEHDGKPHQQKPDNDNCVKALSDTLFAEDGGIADCFSIKRWCRRGQERVEMILYYEK